MTVAKGSTCKQCRREGEKLFLKGQRCFSDKCVLEKKPYVPGQRAKRRPMKTEYYAQLREKQKAKRYYGVWERQFRNYYKKAVKRKGVTGEILLQLLETRLDNIVYIMGFATSRAQARQLISHGHIQVNSRKVNKPSKLPFRVLIEFPYSFGVELRILSIFTNIFFTCFPSIKLKSFFKTSSE